MLLKGYSGCKLEIIEIDGKKYVRKSAADTSYNERLRDQMLKQKNLSIPGFKTCGVYGDGFIDDRYYFIMEYVNGKTFADEMELMELDELEGLIDRFTDYYVNDDYYDSEANAIFVKKAFDVEQKALQKYNANLPDSISEGIDRLRSFDWSHIIKSSCHGDMTMENILIQKGRMYLIDFLDSFYDSWMIDAAKLLQDSEYMWSYRNKHRSPNLCVRMTIFRDLLTQAVLKMPDGNKLMESIYYILLMNFLRIIPYSDNQSDEEYLIETIKKINYRIREEDYV